MIGTSYRGPRTEVPSDDRCFTVSGEHAQAGCREAVYKRPPKPAVPPSGRLYTTAGPEVGVKVSGQEVV
ncbi:unnamed protein product, partial [Staurois parvus]